MQANLASAAGIEREDAALEMNELKKGGSELRVDCSLCNSEAAKRREKMIKNEAIQVPPEAT